LDDSGRGKWWKGEKEEMDADGLVFVDANPRIGALDMDLTAFPHLRKGFKQNDLRHQNIHNGGACLTDERSS
jgi:hypothetical protein